MRKEGAIMITVFKVGNRFYELPTKELNHYSPPPRLKRISG